MENLYKKNDKKQKENKNINMQEYIYGKHTVKSAIEKNYVTNIYVDSSNSEFIKLSEKKRIPCKIYSREKLSNLIDNFHHQGVVASTKKFKYLTIDELMDAVDKSHNKKRIIILDKITDPANVGTIIRNIRAFNIGGLIIGQHSQAQINSTVHRVSTGASFDVNICLINNINNAIRILKKNNYWMLSMDAEGNQTFRDLDQSLSYGIILGSEERGISTLTSKLSDFKIKIPINRNSDSLNVAVASGIVMYELGGNE